MLHYFLGGQQIKFYVCFKWVYFGNGPDAAASIAPTFIWHWLYTTHDEYKLLDFITEQNESESKCQ